MPGKTQPTKDLSGHMPFTAEEPYFHTNMERKRIMIERARANGTLRFKKERNPILSEKTPRNEEFKKEWEFDPGELPENLRKKERWVYPDHNFTIMSKFNSQKEIFAKQLGWETEYNNRVGEYAHEQEEKKKKEEDAKAAALLSARGSARDSARSMMSTARSDVSALSTGRVSLDEPPEELMPASSMKYLNNPQVAAKLRAERAAKYVTSLRNPILPPTYRSVGGRDIFKPTGHVDSKPLDMKIEKKEDMKQKRAARRQSSTPATPVDTARLKQNLGHLMQELENTNNELARQELKIALNTKTKSYERPRGSDFPDSARSGMSARSGRSTGRR